jgi:hypothetical protein
VTDCGPCCECGGTIWLYHVEERYRSDDDVAVVVGQCVACHRPTYFRLDDKAPAVRADVHIRDVVRAHYAHVVRQPRTCSANVVEGQIVLVDTESEQAVSYHVAAPDAYDWAAANGYRIVPGTVDRATGGAS